jgi:uncharacterized membrane protein YqaE (UPF0057 family)
MAHPVFEYSAASGPQKRPPRATLAAGMRIDDCNGFEWEATTMSFGRAVLCIILPPLAVLDRGCGTVLIVFALTLAGWVPGAIAALLLNFIADSK